MSRLLVSHAINHINRRPKTQETRKDRITYSIIKLKHEQILCTYHQGAAEYICSSKMSLLNLFTQRDCPRATPLYVLTHQMLLLLVRMCVLAPRLFLFLIRLKENKSQMFYPFFLSFVPKSVCSVV